MEGLKAHTETSSEGSQRGALLSYYILLGNKVWPRETYAYGVNLPVNVAVLDGCGAGPESPAQVRIGEVSWNILLEKAQVLCWVIYEPLTFTSLSPYQEVGVMFFWSINKEVEDQIHHMSYTSQQLAV